MFTTLVISLYFAIPLPCLAAEVDHPAPAFQATLFDGAKFTLANSTGKVVIIHFWASWCEVCQHEMSTLEKFFKAHRAEGVRIIAIDMDAASDMPKAREIMKHFSFDAAFAKDSDYKAYGRIWRLPLNFLIDQKGVLRKDGWILPEGLTEAGLDKAILPLLKVNENH